MSQFIEYQQRIVTKILGYHTYSIDGLVKTKPQSIDNLVGVEVLMNDGSKGLIPKIHVVNFNELPTKCE